MILVTFTETKETDYKAISKILKAMSSAWACLNNNTWLLESHVDVFELRNVLTPFSPLHLVVFEMEYTKSGVFQCTENIVEFLKNHVSDDFQW